MKRVFVIWAMCTLAASAAWGQVAVLPDLGGADALSTVAQRHMIHLQPEGSPPVWLLAVQRGAYGYPDPEGLHWYRSDDGLTWRYYREIFEDGIEDSELHLTTDVVAHGNDIAVVVSYDSTETGLPSDSKDPARKIYFQWWRFDGKGDWVAQPLVTIGTPELGHGYHRAELAFDSQGRIWVQAWYRSPCSVKAGAACTDTLRIWVSSNGGATFQRQPDFVQLSSLGGGRLISLGDRMMVLWGDYSWDNPAQYMIRDDNEPLSSWSGPFDAFADGDSIYHGAALSAVPDRRGGLHLVYKDRHHNLYYRHFDGNAFGDRQLVDSYSTVDSVYQPAVTLHGDELYVCTNHPVVAKRTYELRSWRLSDGFSSYVVLDTVRDFKMYPTAPERVPANATSIPCASTVGWWPGKLTVAWREVSAQLPEEIDAGTADAGAGDVDAGSPDNGGSHPGTSAVDAGAPNADAGAPNADAGAPNADAGALDAGTPDSGMLDAGSPDAAESDSDDPFAGPVLDESHWVVWTDSPRSAANASEGVLTLSLEPGLKRAGAHVASREPMELLASSVHVRVVESLDRSARASQRMKLTPDIYGDAHVGFWLEGGQLYLTWDAGDGMFTAGALEFSPTLHAWWRVREESGEVFWETSSDGQTWSVRASLPASTLGFSTASVHLMFEVRAWGAVTDGTGTARFDQLDP